jgi:hypothetical protein
MKPEGRRRFTPANIAVSIATLVNANRKSNFLFMPNCVCRRKPLVIYRIYSREKSGVHRVHALPIRSEILNSGGLNDTKFKYNFGAAVHD